MPYQNRRHSGNTDLDCICEPRVDKDQMPGVDIGSPLIGWGPAIAHVRQGALERGQGYSAEAEYEAKEESRSKYSVAMETVGVSLSSGQSVPVSFFFLRHHPNLPAIDADRPMQVYTYECSSE